MATSLSVANTIIYNALKERKSMSPMKLQKLLYMLYACFIAKTKESLFSDRFEAWQYGPVLPNVYFEFKRFGSGNIIDLYTSGDGRAYYIPESGIFGECFSKVWGKFKDYTGMQLSKITHEDEGAWRKKALGEYLDDEDIMNDGKRWFAN